MKPLPHLLTAGLALTLAAVAAAAQTYSSANAYALPTWHSEYAVEPILSVGETVPRTSNASQLFQMVGIPDGTGVYSINQSVAGVYINHELSQSRLSRPLIGAPRIRGAFVSHYRIDRVRRGVISGDLAFTEVYNNSTPVGPIADESNTTPAFARFCSASIAGPREGFDR